MSFVLDNSVSMHWCFGDGKPSELAYAAKVLDAMRDTVVRVPAIWALEVANVLVRAEHQKLLTEAQSENFLGLLADLRIEPDTETFAQGFDRTLQIARRYKLSSYDAAYLELALREGLPLATLDTDLRRAAKRAGAASV